jgi:hypothetical protein
MTGFLQRLVTTAVWGKAGVHPIVRPWKIGGDVQERAWTEFAGEAEPDPGEGTAPAEDAARAEDTAAPTAAPFLDVAAPGHDRPPPTAADVRDRTAPEPPPVPETMTPLFSEIPAARFPAVSGGIVRPPAARLSRSGPPADDPSGPAPERDTPADSARSGPWPAMARPGPTAFPPFRQELREWAGPAASGGAGEADRGDVEIHIGRIEVTAVSLPPAAPVAKAARKSINLSEYLRNGR